jgi:hypothetical protein
MARQSLKANKDAVMRKCAALLGFLIMSIPCGAGAAPDLAGTWYSNEDGCPVDALFLGATGGGHVRMQPDITKEESNVSWTLTGSNIHFEVETFAFHIDGTLSDDKINSVAVQDKDGGIKETCTFERQ